MVGEPGYNAGALDKRPSANYRRRLRLGEMLVASGAITAQQLDHAVHEQKTLKLPIGQVLVKLHYVTDEVMRQELGRQLQIPYLDLEQVVIDRTLARLINASYARRHMVLPVSQAGRSLTVAMDDPTATAIIDDLRRLTGDAITVVTSSSQAIQRGLRRLYEENQGEIALSEAESPESEDAVVLDDQVSRRADELFQQVLLRAIDSRCSDIHLEMLSGGLHIRFRIDGVLRAPDFGIGQEALDRNAKEIISRIKILSRLDIAERRRPQDGSFRVSVDRGGTKVGVDLRVSIIPSHTGESVVIRILDRTKAPRSLAQLQLEKDMAERLEQALRRTTGIFLVTGPTGSGKSTTLYSCLMSLHRPEIRILTAEDPVEYVYEELSQSEVNEDIGNTFAMFLRSFLRHDPEVILIGEIRDEETAEMAFRAAQTGHLLLSTLHTNSAIATLPRLIDLKIDPSLIGASLIGVMSQRLVRQLCPQCKKPDAPNAEIVAQFFGTAKPDMELFRAVGCQQCGFSGYRGRALVADFWLPDERDLLLITERASFEDVRRSAMRTTITMAQDAHARLRAGRTTLEELLRVLPFDSIVEHRTRYGTAPAQGS